MADSKAQHAEAYKNSKSAAELAAAAGRSGSAQAEHMHTLNLL
jgi:hypothetical protein